MKRYSQTFYLVTTEEEAIRFCKRINDNASAYMRRKKPAHYTPSCDGNGNIKYYICDYWN